VAFQQAAQDDRQRRRPEQSVRRGRGIDKVRSTNLRMGSPRGSKPALENRASVRYNAPISTTLCLKKRANFGKL